MAVGVPVEVGIDAVGERVGYMGLGVKVVRVGVGRLGEMTHPSRMRRVLKASNPLRFITLILQFSCAGLRMKCCYKQYS